MGDKSRNNRDIRDMIMSQINMLAWLIVESQVRRQVEDNIGSQILTQAWIQIRGQTREDIYYEKTL